MKWMKIDEVGWKWMTGRFVQRTNFKLHCFFLDFSKLCEFIVEELIDLSMNFLDLLSSTILWVLLHTLQHHPPPSHCPTLSLGSRERLKVGCSSNSQFIQLQPFPVMSWCNESESESGQIVFHKWPSFCFLYWNSFVQTLAWKLTEA